MPGFKQGAGAETGDVQVKGIPDPFHPGKYLTNKVIVKQPGEDSKIVDMPEEHGMTLDPDFGVPVYKSSGKAVEGSAIQAAFIGKKLFKGGQQGSGSGSGGGSDAEKPGGDAGSGVPSTYGAIKDFFKQFVETPSSPSPTPSPTPSPSPTASPLDQIIQQITPTPSPMPSAMPSQTPMPSATPTGTPLDQIMSQMGIDQPEIKAALSSVMGAPPADQAATQNMNLRTDTAAGGALDQIIKKIADASKEAATGKSRKLDKETATQLLIEAGGDKVKARKLAIIRGYDIK
jgi:hypothetical protein